MTINGWIDLPARSLTKKHFPKARGINLEPAEKLLEKDYFFRPIGLAVEKEFGKRISLKEYMEKSKIKGRIPAESFGMQGILMRINRRINQQIKEQMEKHLK